MLRGIWIYVMIGTTICMVSFMLPLIVFAQQTGGLSGLIQLTYQKDRNKDIDAESEKNSFIQEYKLQYQGHVYSPRLLMYSIGGTFRKEDSDTEESRAGKTSTKTKSKDYNFKLDFIQGTKYPFTLFKEKVELPTWTIQPDQTFQTKQTSDRYGLFGNAFLGKGINVRYDIRQDNTKSVGQTETTDRRNRSFMFGVDSRKEDKFVDASYNYQHNFERSKNEFEAINDAKLSWGLRGKTTNFNMDMSYNDNSFTEFTTSTANMNLNYTPSSDFNSNFSIYGNKIEQKENKGYFTTFFGNTTYKISPYLTTNQNLMLYKSTGDFGNDSTQSLTLGLIFTKQAPAGITYSADTSVNGTAQQSNTTKDRNSMFYSLGARVSKFFESINSEANAGSSYYYYHSSLGGKTTRYAFNAGFISRFIKNMTLQSLLNFSEEDTIGDEIEGASSETKTRHLISDNSIGYFLQLGYRGSLDAKIGTIFERGTLPRTFRYANLTFRYAIRRDLSANAGLNFYKESVNSTRTITGFLGVEYKLRGIIMNLKNELWKERGPQGVKTRSSTFLQASRPF
ncbi:hypothetical protein JZK55_09310 [Dissulfurispira thermophila]|uniref:Uncharacterized protein n=2 Tax=Dissulfurispira thermophila TaxID=2715679 RepID=A0A7G1H158_9BACT|nr:hypothetical protein JZK55_09310 [Dissulfurispira thermophila]